MKNFFVEIFVCQDLEKSWATKGGNDDFFLGDERQEGRFFVEKLHIFLGTYPVKWGGESILKEFFDFDNF